MSFFPADGLQELPFIIGEACWPGGASGRGIVGGLAFGYMVGAWEAALLGGKEAL